MEGISGLAPALPVSASCCCELWFSTAPGTTNKHFVTSPSSLSSACSDTSTLIFTACYFKMLFPSSPCCKCVQLEDVFFPCPCFLTQQAVYQTHNPFQNHHLHPFRSVINWSQISQTPGVTPACCSKLPLYRSCANTSLGQLHLQLHRSFSALEADTPRSLSILQSCRRHGNAPQPSLFMPELFPSSKTCVTDTTAPLGARLTRVTPAHAGSSPPAAGLKPLAVTLPRQLRAQASSKPGF